MAVFNSAIGLTLILLLRIVYSQHSVLQLRATRAALKHPGEQTTSSVLNMVKDLSVSGCATAMISLALLYLNVMSFGSLMTLYQSRNGINEYWIGVSQGVAAMVGVFGVTAFPYIEKRFGLIPTAAMAIWYVYIYIIKMYQKNNSIGSQAYLFHQVSSGIRFHCILFSWSESPDLVFYMFGAYLTFWSLDV
jgi:hypothetical protein